MLGIFADSIFTATRMQKWDAPDHWRQHRDQRRARARQGPAAEHAALRRWLRDVGIL